MPYYMSPDANIVIFGHTHTFECDYKNNTLFVNPGEACARNKPISECLMLSITDEQYAIEAYARPIKTKEWTKQSINFERN